MLGCNISGLRMMRDRIKSATGGNLISECAGELAEILIQSARDRTPVDTGRLKAGFLCAETTLSGDLITLTVTNDVEYASFVEYGHSTKGGGWVQGRFMLTLAAEDLLSQAPGVILQELQQFLKGCF